MFVKCVFVVVFMLVSLKLLVVLRFSCVKLLM